jgi:hypothetical protein
LNSALYCFLCLVVFMDGVCRIPVQKSSSPQTTFGFDLRNHQATANIQVTAQVGGVWYVASQLFNNANGTAWTTGLTLNIPAATWITLNFNPGSTLSIGSLSGPFSGAVTGLGFYDAVTSNADPVNNVRIDTVVLNAIPEPSSAALLGLCCLLGMVTSRRR